MNGFPVPATSKGMDALVKRTLIACISDQRDGKIYLCDYGRYSNLGPKIIGIFSAHHRMIKDIRSRYEAIKLLKSELCTYPKSDEYINSSCDVTLFQSATTVAKTAFERSCNRLGFRISKALRKINFPETGDKLVCKSNGAVLNHHLGMNDFLITSRDVRDIEASYSGEKRVFRRKTPGVGQVVWLIDRGICVFKAFDMNFIASATFY